MKNESQGAGDYDRPTQVHRCGRGGGWGKPCNLGPDLAGRCGGTSDCLPVRVGDNFECQRPAWAGGACADGPQPDGRCAHLHPPCQPRRSLRAWRGHVTMLALVACLLGLAASFYLSAPGSRWAANNPGPLSGKHQAFVGQGQCGECHVPPGESGTNLWVALSEAHAFDENCLQCHGFGGSPVHPHNSVAFVSSDPGPRITNCTQCHREHQGGLVPQLRISDRQCQSCHSEAKRFDAFAVDHPELGRRRGGILFDHETHLNVHFAKAEKEGKVTPRSCATCHAFTQSASGGEVRTAGYESACAVCHDTFDNNLKLVVMPSPEDGLDAIDWELLPLTPLLLSTNGVGGEPFNERLKGIIRDLEEPAGSVARFRSLLVQEPRGADLLAGLSDALLSGPALAFKAGDFFENFGDDPKPGSWFWREEDESLVPQLAYHPTGGHGDPVIQAWLEFMLVAKETGAEGTNALQSIRRKWTDASNGPGRCFKCHRAPQEGEAVSLASIWHYRGSQASLYTRFSHAAHPPFVPAGNPSRPSFYEWKGFKEVAGQFNHCAFCHTPSVGAGGAKPKQGDRQFQPVQIRRCQECHAPGKVRNDCLLCHAYHREPEVKAFASQALSRPVVPPAPGAGLEGEKEPVRPAGAGQP